MFDESKEEYERMQEYMLNRQYDKYMNKQYEAYMSMQEDEYYFGGCVEEIRRFAREDVLTEISKEASEYLLNVALGLEEFSGWMHLKKEAAK